MSLTYDNLILYVNDSRDSTELATVRESIEGTYAKRNIGLQDYINLTTLCNSHKDLLDLVATIQESYLKEEEL